jgi:hypothetical protein
MNNFNNINEAELFINSFFMRNLNKTINNYLDDSIFFDFTKQQIVYNKFKNKIKELNYSITSSNELYFDDICGKKLELFQDNLIKIFIGYTNNNDKNKFLQKFINTYDKYNAEIVINNFFKSIIDSYFKTNNYDNNEIMKNYIIKKLIKLEDNQNNHINLIKSLENHINYENNNQEKLMKSLENEINNQEKIIKSLENKINNQEKLMKSLENELNKQNQINYLFNIKLGCLCFFLILFSFNI